ncbi:BglG family transcription antiterminator [Aeromonas cavernicola]|uniref:Transcription antiterminator BglG n=1 Tax=Aeromonas cavernicola TaxID=1006623 RepID=A0A2H9U6Y9_9GAMM|nr:PTS sugar transporter subunit IIA [Aeromonas cavernicola]PJG59816.1 transcription antiterminator BglG [Aeromonas cavernicola]
MTKLSHPRLHQLLAQLQAAPLPQEELARRLNVSTRTVRTDVATLNELIAAHGAHLIHQRGSGYQLKIYNQGLFNELLAAQEQEVSLPRTSRERVLHLQILLLTAEQGIKLDELADTWYLSRAALQGDMAEVRERLAHFGLTIDSKPRLGMRIQGCETAIRACLTQLLYQELLHNKQLQSLLPNLCPSKTLEVVGNHIHAQLTRHQLRLVDENLQQLTIYCAVALLRQASGHELHQFTSEDLTPQMLAAARDIYSELPTLTLPVEEEIACLAIQIQARLIAEPLQLSAVMATESEQLVGHLLDYIHQHYPYDLRYDLQLRADLQTHICAMLLRVKYQIGSHNPLADHIKQYYPLAYDITLAAISEWIKQTPYRLTHHEIGYLVIHIGVGLERHYDIGYTRHPQALLLCDAGNATFRVLEARIKREYPQLQLTMLESVRDYEGLGEVLQDFVISTVKVTEKNAPVIQVAPFPTQYQLEQLGKLVLIDRTRPYMLDKYFDASHFLIVNEPLTQTQLFQQVCDQLEQEDLVEMGFRTSLHERERIVSTMLGEGIALPHSLGLLARRTLVYTILAPQGIDWGNGETASLIFVLAISKADYEEAMALYDLFLTLMNEKASKNLLACRDFASFKALARAG